MTDKLPIIDPNDDFALLLEPAWYEIDHPAWRNFVAWSRLNVVPGYGQGHIVIWYWKIYKAGWEANHEHE